MAISGASGGAVDTRTRGGAGRVRVGVVGVGDGWPAQRDALRALPRVEVVAVTDAVPLRAESAAAEVGAAAAGGALALARRPDVRAVLLGDPAWWGLSALDLLLTADKPVLAAGPVDPADDRLDALAARAASSGAVVVPDLSARFTPATLRLRELAATDLGPVRSVRLTAPRPSPSPLAESYGQPVRAGRLAGLLDWCAHLLPAAVHEVSAAGPADAPASVELRCGPGSESAGAAVTFRDEPGGGAEAVVTCERGAATLAGERELRVAADGEPERTEGLSAERPGFETLLTLFLRRAVGGLIPAPDLHDLSAATALCRAAAESAARGEPVAVVGGERRVRPR